MANFLLYTAAAVLGGLLGLGTAFSYIWVTVPSAMLLFLVGVIWAYRQGQEYQIRKSAVEVINSKQFTDKSAGTSA